MTRVIWMVGYGKREVWMVSYRERDMPGKA